MQRPRSPKSVHVPASPLQEMPLGPVAHVAIPGSTKIGNYDKSSNLPRKHIWNAICCSCSVPPRNIRERLFAFACRAVDIYRHLVAGGGAGRLLAPQFLDAATSAAANMEEADGAASKKDFIAKANISLKEARESHFWLRLFGCCAIGDPMVIRPAEREANELVAIITTIVKNARARTEAEAL